MGQDSDFMRGVGSQHPSQTFRTGSPPNAKTGDPGVTQNESASTTHQGVELTISKPSLEELNEGILQAKVAYATAHMRGDQKGMALAVQTASNLQELGGTVSFSAGQVTSQPRAIIESPADRGTARRNPDGSVVIGSGDDAGTVVTPPRRPDVALQNIIIENSKVRYFRAQILGDTRTMEEASREANQARAKGGTLRADEDTPLTRSLKRYVNQVDVIKTAIRTRDTLDLNKGIFQLKNDYMYAQNTNDPVGMEASRIMGDILRKLGGTIGPEVSLADAKKMIEVKPTPPASPPPVPPVDTSPKSAEIYDRVLGFVTGAGVAAGENLLSMIQAHSDPLGAALEGIHGFVVGLRTAYRAASDWEKTVGEIDKLLSEFRDYYRTAPAYEKGKLEGQLLIDTLGSILGNKKVMIKNGKLANSVHPVSGVPFDVDGFPIFDAKFEARIYPEFYKSGPDRHKKEAIQLLKKAIAENPELKKQFTAEQLTQINDLETPTGYVWHHHQDVGRMQLVEKDIHAATGHTGGMAIWGRE